MAEPIPVTAPDGIADWTDYQNNWRDADATWLQDRIILRATNDAMRDSFSQLPGGVVYNRAFDVLQVRSSAGGYKTLTPIPANLSLTDQAAPTNTTTIQRVGAAGGIVLSAADISVGLPLKVLTDVLLVNSGGLTLKVGAKPVVISTNATDLTIDSPVTVTGLITGNAPGTIGFTTTKQVVAGSFSGASATLTGALSAQTISVSGLSVNASGLLTGVNAQGFKVGQGQVYGDGTYMYLQGSAKNSTWIGIPSTGSIRVDGGGYFEILSQTRFWGYNPQWVSGGAVRGLGYCVTSYGDPGVGNVPEGAIYIA